MSTGGCVRGDGVNEWWSSLGEEDKAWREVVLRAHYGKGKKERGAAVRASGAIGRSFGRRAEYKCFPKINVDGTFPRDKVLERMLLL